MKKIWWGLGGLAAVIGIGGVSTAAWLNSVSGVGSAYKQLNADAKAVESQHPVHAADPSSMPPAPSTTTKTITHSSTVTASTPYHSAQTPSTPAANPPSSAPATPDPSNVAASSPQSTAIQDGVWYPSKPQRVGIVIPLPSGYKWQRVADIYRSWGALWTQKTANGQFGQREQVALSLNTESVSSYGSPSGVTLQYGGNTAAKVWIWKNPQNNTIHGTEIVGLGNTHGGWRGVWGNPNHVNGLPEANTLLINITLPDTAQNRMDILQSLAHWAAGDIRNHALDAEQEKATCTVNCWVLPSLKLNPSSLIAGLHGLG